jgi:hypothetical protein
LRNFYKFPHIRAILQRIFRAHGKMRPPQLAAVESGVDLLFWILKLRAEQRVKDHGHRQRRQHATHVQYCEPAEARAQRRSFWHAFHQW